jgi:hypothetical protein
MSKMSDLDLMVRDGARTSEDFIGRGIDARTARAMAAVVEASVVVEPEGKLSAEELANVWAREQLAAASVRRATPEPEPEGAFGHGPGCYGECDGEFDCYNLRRSGTSRSEQVWGFAKLRKLREEEPEG